MDKQQADHLSFGGQGLFGENTNADQVINTKHKAIGHMTLTDESWKEVWSLLDWGIHPFTGIGCILQTRSPAQQVAATLEWTTDK